MIRVEPHVVWQDVPGELVLFDQRGNAYHCLDAVGSEIWRRLAQGDELATVTSALVERYDAPAGRIEADVAAFVADARSKGLVTDTAAG